MRWEVDVFFVLTTALAARGEKIGLVCLCRDEEVWPALGCRYEMGWSRDGFVCCFIPVSRC